MIFSQKLEEYFAVHGDGLQSRLEELQERGKPSASPPQEVGSESLEQGRSVDNDGSRLPLDSPLEIERPRSALHSGDFREGSPDAATKLQQSQFDARTRHHLPCTPPSAPWYSEEPQPLPKSYSLDEPLLPTNLSVSAGSQSRLRAPSLGSLSSSYVLKPPTSPLVYQASNIDLDKSHDSDLLELSPSERVNRRRTLPPEVLRASSLSYGVSQNYRFSPGPPYRDGVSYQGNHSRRSSASGFTLQPASSPQNPFLPRARRPSQSFEQGPLYHASMVGSFEESILRGRMSMSPSRPLEFTAQVGVLGKGNCKANLKCPPHVTVSFPAVFYSYPTAGGGRTISDDSPSPYVGYIDVENSFPKETRPIRKSPMPVAVPPKCPCIHQASEERVSNSSPPSQQERRTKEKRSRRGSQSPKSPVGGCYRIPQQGQLQIVIKNPNKTAVKLFLVPYDLEGMEPGTKTFIRQRSYSVGPAVDAPLSSENPVIASENSLHSANEKPVLRYLVHFNICCSSKGRYYLYSGIRVVFANRVPDGKEKLRNEVHLPEPRYSLYKPAKEAGSGAAKYISENASKRRSTGPGYGLRGPLDLVDFGPAEAGPFGLSAQPPLAAQLAAPSLYPHPSSPASLGEMAMELNPRLTPSNREFFGPRELRSLDGFSRTSPLRHPPAGTPTKDTSKSFYTKLNKGDAGYGGQSPTSSLTTGSGSAESLLARKLRDLRSTSPELL